MSQHKGSGHHPILFCISPLRQIQLVYQNWLKKSPPNPQQNKPQITHKFYRGTLSKGKEELPGLVESWILSCASWGWGEEESPPHNILANGRYRIFYILNWENGLLLIKKSRKHCHEQSSKKDPSGLYFLPQRLQSHHSMPQTN